MTAVNPSTLQTLLCDIEQRIRIAFPEGKFDYDIVPANLTPEVWTRLTRTPPFVGMGWSKVEPLPMATRQFEGDVHFELILVDKNDRTARDQMLGDVFSPGVFAMLDAAVANLHGITFASGGTCLLQDVENVSSEGLKDNFAMLALRFRCPVTFPSVAANGVAVGSWQSAWILGPDTADQIVDLEIVE